MMRSVPMNTNGAGNKGLLELKTQKGAEHKEVRQIVVGEGQGFSKENGSRSTEVSGSVRHASKGTTLDGLQKQQQQPKSQAVSWERFLPLRSLKVLLVENDDSTRHVVSALLRNCNYEVTAVSNGIQAWKILRDLPNHIDLVLTEVVIPCLSGIGLLGKIMSHKSCKIIPVIMMSSNDSMGIVFKCLSDGAVDFLVKPVRKNELKNLWQHVWRKCQSSSDSGSESGIHIQKDSKESFEECNNDTSSKNEEDNESIGMSARHGTGSQQNSSENGHAPVLRSPPTRKEIEVDSPKPVLQFTQLVDRVNSTFDQAIHPNPEAVSTECVPVTATDCLEQDKQLLDDVAMGKDLEIGVPGVQVLQNEYPSANDSTGLICTQKDKLLGLESGRGDELASGNLNSVSPIGELSAQTAVLTGLVMNSTIPIETIISDAPNGLTRIAEVKDKYIPDSKEITSFQLSLTRLRGAGDVSAATSDDKNTRRNTDISAFSRYNTTSTTNHTPTGIIGSCSLLNSSSVAEKTNSMNNFPADSNSSHPIHRPSSISNNDMGSSTKNALTWTEASNGKSAPISTTKHINPSSPHRSTQNNHVYPLKQVISQNANNETVNMELEEPRREQQQVQIQHHHHHYHHYHHHVHNTEQQVPPPDDDDLSLKNITGASPQCGSTNVFGGSFEANAGKRSFDGSGSGSNQGSNGQNGSNTAVNAGGVNIESYNNVAGRSGGCGSTGDGSGGSGSNQGSNGQNGSSTAVNAGGVNIESYNNVAGRSGGCGSTGDGSGGEMNQFSMEADLTKFCQKRKDRSFEKVRSDSRKKLAEERPRIRGQLVRPAAYKQGSPDSDCA